MPFGSLAADTLVAAAGYFLGGFAFLLVYLSRRDGLFHLVQGGIIVLSAGVFNRLMQGGAGLPSSISLTLVVGVLLGIVTELLVYGMLRRHNASSESFLLASLGGMLVLQHSTSILLGAAPLYLERHREIAARFSFLGSELSVPNIATIITAIVAGGIFGALYAGSLGRRLAAIRHSTFIADWRGGRSARDLLTIAASSGLLIAAAGILAHLEHRIVISEFGFRHILPVIVVALTAVSASSAMARAIPVPRRSSRLERLLTVLWLGLAATGLALVTTTTARYADPRWSDSILLAVAILTLVAFAGKRLRTESSTA